MYLLCISAYLLAAGGNSRSRDWAVLGSACQQGTYRCSATECRAALGGDAEQRFRSSADREDSAVPAERMHCGAQTSAGREAKPT